MDAREQVDPTAKANGRAKRAGAARLTLPRSRRLQHDLEYEAVYEAKMRKSDGPLTVFVMPNGRAHWRLGLSIGKRVGGAVVRTRVKRMIREVFRLHQPELPLLADGTGCDMVVSSRAHDPVELDIYAAALLSAAGAAHAAWARRLQRKDGGKDSAKNGGAS